MSKSFERKQVACIWSCTKCALMGTIEPYSWPGEESAETAKRHAAEMRGRCVAGCLYQAQPTDAVRMDP